MVADKLAKQVNKGGLQLCVQDLLFRDVGTLVSVYLFLYFTISEHQKQKHQHF